MRQTGRIHAPTSAPQLTFHVKPHIGLGTLFMTRVPSAFAFSGQLRFRPSAAPAPTQAITAFQARSRTPPAYNRNEIGARSAYESAALAASAHNEFDRTRFSLPPPGKGRGEVSTAVMWMPRSSRRGARLDNLSVLPPGCALDFLSGRRDPGGRQSPDSRNAQTPSVHRSAASHGGDVTTHSVSRER